MRPKKENRNVGFLYTVSEEKIKAYGKLTLEQKLKWLEEGSRFIYSVQSKEERKRVRAIKNQII
jgi:hypothetical protein